MIAALDGQKLAPFAPAAERFERGRLVHRVQEVLQTGGEEGDVRLVEIVHGHVVFGVGAGIAAEVHHAAHHADAGALAEHGSAFGGVEAADHHLAAAHEFAREGAGAVENPEFGLGVERIVLHERAGTGARAAADVDDARCRAVTGGVAGVALHGDARAGVEPAHVGGGGAFHHDFGVIEAHAAHALTGIGHMEAQGAAFGVPEGAADVVLTGRMDVEFRFAPGHGLADGQQQILRGHAFVLNKSIYGKHCVAFL